MSFETLNELSIAINKPRCPVTQYRSVPLVLTAHQCCEVWMPSFFRDNWCEQIHSCDGNHALHFQLNRREEMYESPQKKRINPERWGYSDAFGLEISDQEFHLAGKWAVRENGLGFTLFAPHQLASRRCGVTRFMNQVLQFG